jgi:hypothetical protein
MPAAVDQDFDITSPPSFTCTLRNNEYRCCGYLHLIALYKHRATVTQTNLALRARRPRTATDYINRAN